MLAMEASNNTPVRKYYLVTIYIYIYIYRAVGSILKPVWLFSSIDMTLNLIIEEVVFLV